MGPLPLRWVAASAENKGRPPSQLAAELPRQLGAGASLGLRSPAPGLLLAPHWAAGGVGSIPFPPREAQAGSQRAEASLKSSSGLCLKVTEVRFTAREQIIPMWS